MEFSRILVNYAKNALWAGAFLLAGCQVGRYEPDAKFVDLYAELKVASVALSQDMDRTGEMRRVILAQHGMTPAEFHEHFMRLASHPEAWKSFQERVIQRMDAFQREKTGGIHG